MNPVRSKEEPIETPVGADEAASDVEAPEGKVSSNRLTYARLAEEHLEAIMEIEQEAYPEPWTLGMFKDEISGDRSFFWTAFLDGEIIGYAGYWLVLDEAHVTSLTVTKAQRGQGFGYEQLHHLMDNIARSSVQGVTLEVRETNEAARHIYEKEGFEVVGKRKAYYSKTQEDAIIMLKKLS